MAEHVLKHNAAPVLSIVSHKQILEIRCLLL